MKRDKYTHLAIPQEKPTRLQEYGVGIFPTLTTKSALKKALKKKLISVDGKVGETSTFIQGNECITFHPVKEKHDTREFVLKLEVLYEDDFLAVINKPSGVLTSGNSFKTIANALGQNLKKSNQPDTIKPQPAHRLDFATSGLLLIGKTSASLLDLNHLFENKQIAKTYYAVTIGNMKTSGTIAIPVDGKDAISKFEVIETVVSDRFQFLNLLRLTPKTGRRHQLRKHLSETGNPILGDSDYGKEGLILKGKGLYLHAFSLAFVHPITGKEIYIEMKLPAKFNKIFPYHERFPLR